MDDIEWVVVPEACDVEEVLFGLVSILKVHLPRAPLLHDAKELKLVVSLVDELLGEATSNLLFDRTDAIVLIDDFHPVASKLTAVHLVTVFIGKVRNLLQDQIVELHQLHARERLDIHPSNAC